MTDLLRYLEGKGQTLDQAPASQAAKQTSTAFVSCIRFNGIPILPPVLTLKRREEMQTLKRKAKMTETRIRAKRRERLVARFHSQQDDQEVNNRGTNETQELSLVPSKIKQGNETRLIWLSNHKDASHQGVSGVIVDNRVVEVVPQAASTTDPPSISESTEPTSDQFGGTLDSLSDFTSLDDASLPTEIDGIPITSQREQRISQVLARLTKVLNLSDDPLTSSPDTSESSQITVEKVAMDKNARTDIEIKTIDTDNTCNSENSINDSNDSTIVDEQPVISNQESTESIKKDQLGDVHSKDTSPESIAGKLNAKNASSILLSPIRSLGEAQKSGKISPNIPKNTVHFASFVTEINTSASECENFTLKKLTGSSSDTCSPSDSQTMMSNHMMPLNVIVSPSDTSVPIDDQMTKSLQQNTGQIGQGKFERIVDIVPAELSTIQTLLSKVNLSPDDASSSSNVTGSISASGLPFMAYTGEGETSDKENEFSARRLEDDNRIEDLLENSAQSSGHYGLNIVVDEELSSPSQNTTSSQTLTLVENANNDGGSNPSSHMTSSVGLPGGTASTDLDQYMRDSAATITSDMTMTEEVNSSYADKEKTMDTELRKTNYITSSQGESVKKGHIRKGSYTLSEPSPVLLKAQAHLVTEHIAVMQSAGQLLTEKQSLTGSSVKPIQRKLDYDEDDDAFTQSQDSDGKSEHMRKYLAYLEQNAEKCSVSGSSIADLDRPRSDHSMNVQLTESVGGMQTYLSSLENSSSMSELEFIKVHTETLDQMKQQLIEQQQRQLEELMVSQRRQQMQFQNEIMQRQKNFKLQQSLILQNSQQIMRAKASVSQDWRKSQQNVAEQNRQYSEQAAFDVQRSQLMSSQSTLGQNQEMYLQHLQSQLNSSQSTVGGRSSYVATSKDESEASMHYAQSALNAKYKLQQAQAVARDHLLINNADFNINKNSEKVENGHYRPNLFGNEPVVSPKLHKPVVRSPRKSEPMEHRSMRLVIPNEIFDPRMKTKFVRLSAVAKGFLTRRLVKTEKVQSLIKTIKDTKEFAVSFQSETSIRQGTFTMQDRDLLERIIAQLQAALLDVHEIFFVISISDRMSIISQSRQLQEERRLKDHESRVSISRSNPKMSSATLKAMERKRQAQVAESAVFGISRPKSAPPTTSSPRRSHQDIDHSSPIRRQFQFLFSRALKPIQGQFSPIRPVSEASTRGSVKNRLKVAAEGMSHQTTVKTKQTVKNSKTTNSKGKNSNKGKAKSDKAWR